MGHIPPQHAARLEAMEQRARTIAEAGGLDAALGCGALANPIDTTLAEGLVLGLLRQGVRKYLAVCSDEVNMSRVLNFQFDDRMSVF